MHLNGALLCSIDTETTGLDPTKHEIIEIAIIPLDHALKPHPKVHPFHLKMRPDMPENADFKAMDCNKTELYDLVLNGVPQATGADLLEKWFNGLGLGDGKKLVPLGHNYATYDQRMIEMWLGPANYAHIFDYHIRDTMAVSLFLNDRTYFVNEKVPFPKHTLSYVASQLNVKNPAPHTALGDAWTVAEVYRKMMGKLPVVMGENK